MGFQFDTPLFWFIWMGGDVPETKNSVIISHIVISSKEIYHFFTIS